MSNPVIRIKVLQKPQIRGKMDVRFPAKVEVENFLTLTKANGVYTFGVDYTKLNELGITDPATAKIAVLDQSGNVYKIVSVADILSGVVKPDDLAEVAFTGDYDDLSNKPALGTAAAADVGDFATAAQGVPAGGTTGQVLAKNSGTDGDTEWVDQTGGGGSDPTNVKTYGASGSSATTTGSITSGSSTLTLASALDFEDGQGVLVFGAGPATTVGVPAAVGLVPTNATGSTTYDYKIASIDNQGGVSAASSSFGTTIGYATLGAYMGGTTGMALNKITWTNGTGSPLATAVWRSKNGGAYDLLGCFKGTSIYDTGLPTQSIVGIPTTPPASAVPGWLATTISSGGGTATLTLGASATTTAAGVLVQHDDTDAINSAMAANTSVTFSAGAYNVRSLQIPSTVHSVIGASGGYSVITSFAQTSLLAGVSATMAGNPLYVSGMKIVAAIPMAFDGFTVSGASQPTINDSEFIGKRALRVTACAAPMVVSNRVTGWWDLGIYSDNNTDAKVLENTVGAISGTVSQCAGAGYPTGTGYPGVICIGSGSGDGCLIALNTITSYGGNFGISAGSPNTVVRSNVVKFTGREAIVNASWVDVRSNYCYWAPAGNGNKSSYDFGSSMADGGGTGNGLARVTIAGNTYVNSAFASIAVFGSGSAGSPITDVYIGGNTISGSNQLAAFQAGVSISGSNVSGVIVNLNTFQSPGANMTFQVAEQNAGNGTPHNNTVNTQLGPAGSSGKVQVLGSGSVYLDYAPKASPSFSGSLMVTGSPTAPTIDSSPTTLTIAASSSAQVAPNASGLLVVRENTSYGEQAICMIGFGGGVLNIAAGTHWSIISTSPVGGNVSVGFDGSVWRIYNGTGATRNFSFGFWRIA